LEKAAGWAIDSSGILQPALAARRVMLEKIEYMFYTARFLRGAMPDPNPSNRKRARKPEGFIQESLPETGVPPAAEGKPRRKHGFYDRFFSRFELSDLDVLDAEKLFGEIALMRVALRRCFEAASTIEADDIENWVKALSALGGAATRLANLLRSQKALSLNGEDEWKAIISQGLTEVLKEMNL
jgi:hypothetical protein